MTNSSSLTVANKQSLQLTIEPPAPDLRLCEDFMGACSDLLRLIHRDLVTEDALEQAEEHRRNLPKLQRIIEGQFGYASHSDIALEVSKLAGSYPSASRQDLSAYARILCDDIADARPTVQALRAAMKQLRQSSRYLPSVAEVLMALKVTKAPWTDYRFYLENFDKHLAEAKHKLRGSQRRRPEQRALPSPERWASELTMASMP